MGYLLAQQLVARGEDVLDVPATLAVTQICNPGTEGRIYFERKVAEGKTKKEALRSLKRQFSNAVYRQLLLDAR
jgi:transposase